MEARILRPLIVLGVPGVALGVFYLLLSSFHFSFGEIAPTWAAIIAIIFLVIVGGTTAFALHRFAPAATRTDDSPDRKRIDRVESRKEDWLQEALNHAEDVLRRIDAARASAIEAGGLMQPDQIQVAILEALTPEYSPDRLKVVEALNNDALRESLANVQEAFRAIRFAQMDLAHRAAPASEEHEPTYAVQWYTTQLQNFASIARRLLAGS